MSDPTVVARLEEAGLIPGTTRTEKEALAGLSEQELQVLQSIKSRLDEAIGEDTVHRPEDGGLFW